MFYDVSFVIVLSIPRIRCLMPVHFEAFEY